MVYEIRFIGPGDSTTSGPLHMSEAEALALFEADCRTLSDAETTVELSNYATDEVLRQFSRKGDEQ